MSLKSYRISLKLLSLTVMLGTQYGASAAFSSEAPARFTGYQGAPSKESSYHKDFNKNLNSSSEILTKSSYNSKAKGLVKKLIDSKRQEPLATLALQAETAGNENHERYNSIIERLKERRLKNVDPLIAPKPRAKDFIKAAPETANKDNSKVSARDIMTQSVAAADSKPIIPVHPSLQKNQQPNDFSSIPNAPFKPVALKPRKQIVTTQNDALIEPPDFESVTVYPPSIHTFKQIDVQPTLGDHLAAFNKPSAEPEFITSRNSGTLTEISSIAPSMSETKEFTVVSTQLNNNQLSDETKDILYSLPEKITGLPPKRKKSGRFAIKRELAAQTALQSSTPESESDDMNISVQKRMAVNYDRILEQAFDALSSGNAELASSLYKEVTEAEPKNIDGRFGLATTYHRLGMLEKARNEYGFLLHQQPDHLEGLNNFLALVGEESPEEAVKYLIKLADRNPDYSPLWAQVSSIYQRQGDIASAVDAMERARVVTPENIVYSFNLAVLYDELGNGAKASSFYRQVLSASERGEAIPVEIADVQDRLTYLSTL